MQPLRVKASSIHMWQSQVEIPLHNSTALPRSKHCSAKLPLRAGLICAAKMHEYLISLYVARMSPAIKGSSVLHCFECSNTVEIHNGIMFDFYPGLPHMISS